MEKMVIVGVAQQIKNAWENYTEAKAKTDCIEAAVDWDNPEIEHAWNDAYQKEFKMFCEMVTCLGLIGITENTAKRMIITEAEKITEIVDKLS